MPSGAIAARIFSRRRRAAHDGNDFIRRDDPQILSSYQRALRKAYTIQTALGGREGMERLRANGVYPVIVSDMRMPEMNGCQFLATVKEISPRTIRFMLTGNATLEVALSAVNEGAVSRILTRPIRHTDLALTIREALRQKKLETKVKEWLETSKAQN